MGNFPFWPGHSKSSGETLQLSGYDGVVPFHAGVVGGTHSWGSSQSSLSGLKTVFEGHLLECGMPAIQTKNSLQH